MDLASGMRAHSTGLLQRVEMRQSRASPHVCHAFGRGGSQSAPLNGFKLSPPSAGQQPIRTVEATPPSTSPPVPIIAAGGLGLVAAAAFLVKRFRGQYAESMYGIESYSYGDSSRGTKDMFGTLIKKNMNTTTLPELSEEMIAAARARRQKERANHRLSLEDVELPDNHPWAVKAQVSPEEEEAVRARLRIRPRVRPAMPMEEQARSSRRIIRSRPASAPVSDASGF